MENKSTNLDKLERFFDEELSQEELKALEQELEQNDFKEDALFFQSMVDVLEEEGKTQREQILEGVDVDNIDANIRADLVAQNKRLVPTEASKTQTAKVRQLRPIRQMLAIAASILVLIIAGTLWVMMSGDDVSTLASENYLNADLPGTMSGGIVEDEIFQAALENFSTEADLEAAKTGFRQIPSNSRKYSEAQYFLGHIHAQQEEFEAAITNYQAALAAENLPNYINRDKLSWNLLLAKLGAGQDVRSQLDELIQNANPPIDRMAKALKDKL